MNKETTPNINEIENKFDTIYQADIDVFNEKGILLGTHNFDYNGTWDAVESDDVGLCRIKEKSLYSLKRWLQAIGANNGHYLFKAIFLKNDGYGDEYLDEDEGEFDWDLRLVLIKFYI